MRNADVENLGARGNKTGVAMLVISLSLLHKTRDTPNSICIVIHFTRLAYKLAQRSRPPPPPPTVFTLHSPPLISHPCVLYCALLACGHIFLVFPIPFSFLFHKEVVVFWRQCSKFNLQDNAELFLIHFRKDDSPHCTDFPALFS